MDYRIIRFALCVVEENLFPGTAIREEIDIYNERIVWKDIKFEMYNHLNTGDFGCNYTFFQHQNVTEKTHKFVAIYLGEHGVAELRFDDLSNVPNKDIMMSAVYNAIDKYYPEEFEDSLHCFSFNPLCERVYPVIQFHMLKTIECAFQRLANNEQHLHGYSIRQPSQIIGEIIRIAEKEKDTELIAYILEMKNRYRQELQSDIEL